MAVDTEAIIGQAVVEADFQTDDAPTPDVESTTAPVEPAVEAAPVEPEAKDDKPAPTEEDELSALEKELVATTPGLQKGRISVARHQAVLTRARNKAEADLKAATEKYAKYGTQEWTEREAAILLAENHPETFFREVLLQSPAYAKLVEAEFERRGLKVPAAVTKAADAADDGPTEKPKPDRLLEDGTLGYTAEGADKLAQWHAREAAKAHKAELAAFNEKINPILEERKNAEIVAHFKTQSVAKLEDARQNWDGFKDLEPKVYEWLMQPENRRKSLEDGYRAVVLPTLRLNREQMKAELTKEIVAGLNKTKAKPTLASALPTPSGVSDDAAPRDTEALVREAMRSIPA